MYSNIGLLLKLDIMDKVLYLKLFKDYWVKELLRW